MASDKASDRAIGVFGANTFLGRHLARLLGESGRWRKVLAIDDRAAEAVAERVESHAIDPTEAAAGAQLTDLFRAEKVDAVVHLGLLESPTHATAWAHEVEVIGTMHLAEACLAAGVRKIVAWSTTMLYGARPDNPNFLTETHPPRPGSRNSFLQDKLEAEKIVGAMADRSGKKMIVTVLRTAPILGPTVRSYVTRYLSRRFVPVVLGYDPLVQFLHEADAVAAFELAIAREVPGVFNVVADGVLPLSTVIKLAGRIAAPIPYVLARRAAEALWVAQMIEAPAPFLDHLRYLCIADGSRAKKALGFQPVYTTREALLHFVEASTQRRAAADAGEARA